AAEGSVSLPIECSFVALLESDGTRMRTHRSPIAVASTLCERLRRRLPRRGAQPDLHVLVEVDLDLAIEHLPRLGLVDVLLPHRDDDGRHAVADQIAQRARDAH